MVKDKKPLGTLKPGRGSTPRGSGRAGLRPSGRSPRGDPPAEPFWEGAGGNGVTPAERGGRGRRLRGRGMVGAVMGGDAGPDRKSKVGVLGAGWVHPTPWGAAAGGYWFPVAAGFSLPGVGRATASEH